MVEKMSNIPNPLRKHFRQPAIHVRLPSQGKFYPNGALIMSPNGEIPVLPMTAVDEITSRTPDALFNGSAVADIIGSCIPAIRDPWSIPTIDLNALLISVRLASYGHKMEISSICPACQHENELELDLRTVMDRLEIPDYERPLTVGDLTVSFIPLTYRQVNENNKMQFEDQKLAQAVNGADLPEEERMKMLGDSFRKITNLTIHALSLSIRNIKTADALVTDQTHIEEFLHNCEKAMFEKIRDHAINLRQKAEIKPLNIECSECSHKYLQEFSLDMSNFFATNS
jgi:hypothetical protein